MSEETPDSSSCIACRSRIAAGATICHFCSSYQASWRNELRYLANVVGVFSIAAALLTYAGSNVGAVRRALWRKSLVAVMSYDSSQQATLVNEGDDDTFVSYIYVSTSAPDYVFSKQQPINARLARGEIRTIQTGEDKPSGFAVANVSDEAWRKLLQSAANANSKSCIDVTFFSRNSGAMAMLRDRLGSELRTFPAHAIVHYYSIAKGGFERRSFEVEGVLYHDQGCRTGPD